MKKTICVCCGDNARLVKGSRLCLGCWIDTEGTGSGCDLHVGDAFEKGNKRKRGKR